jgi:hypothetical protein
VRRKKCSRGLCVEALLFRDVCSDPRLRPTFQNLVEIFKDMSKNAASKPEPANLKNRQPKPLTDIQEI